jgi:hypothetical protein
MTIISKKNAVKSLAKKRFSLISLFCASALLTACGTINVNVSNKLALPCTTRIAVGPLANNSSTPLANRQVESMLTGILQVKGFRNVVAYPRQKSCEKLLYCADEGMSPHQLAHWARKNHIAYIFTGSTNEWGYKVGLDGEPVAGVSLGLINATSGRTEWTGVGSAIGNSRTGLDVIGQQLLNVLLAKNIMVY